MARYFLDTGVLLGYTFLHDMWRAEAETVFDPENSLYIDRVVLFEYCNSTDENSLQETDVDWETEEGRFGEIIQFAEGVEPILDMALETYNEEELTVEALIDEFISAADIDEDIDEQKRKEYIRPTLRDFILDELDGEPLTRSNVTEITTALFATIIDGGREKREEIKNRVAYCVVAEDDREQYVPRLIETMIRGDNEPPESIDDGKPEEYSLEHSIELGKEMADMDTLILADLAHLKDRQVVSTMITNDKNHIYSKHNRIDAAIGVNIQYIKDSVADRSLP
jgi:predicted nucleic acid-binding protein